MDELGKWVLLDEIGRGGQGTVFKAVDSEQVFNAKRTSTRIGELMANQTAGIRPKPPDEGDIQGLTELVGALAEFDECFGALKRLKPEAREKARARMELEIGALSKMDHPHLAEILDHNAEEGWFVTRYYKNGSLAEDMRRYGGNALGALKAVRGVVDALAKMLEKKLVHRDVKPANIFVADDDHLVLGDLGLVFDLDAEGRLSSTMESAGTPDWMAPWAHVKRLEDTTSTLDVYGIGKVLYCLVAGRDKLNREYHREPGNDLETLFPDQAGMSAVNRLLDGCIVEREADCKYGEYPELLADIDSTIEAVALERREMPDEMGWLCRVCGQGNYRVKDYDPNTRSTQKSSLRDFGLEPTDGKRSYKIAICDRCGHVELFGWLGKTPRPPGARQARPSALDGRRGARRGGRRGSGGRAVIGLWPGNPAGNPGNPT